MKVGLFLTKKNRKIYSAIHAAYRKGIRNVGWTLYDKSHPDLDLIITCSRTPSGITKFSDYAEKHNIRFLANDTSVVTRQGVSTIHQRDKHRQTLKGDNLVFCDMYGPKNSHYQSIKNAGNRADAFKWKFRNEAGGEYTLIPEQLNPELNHNAYGGGVWSVWLDSILQTIKGDVVINLHPNRGLTPKSRVFDTKMYKRYPQVRIVKGLASQWISSCHTMVALSSWAVLEAMMVGKKIEYYDSSCPIYNYSSSANRQEWFKNFVYSFWSLQEITSGEYLRYLKEKVL